jgi:hypothetical protein
LALRRRSRLNPVRRLEEPLVDAGEGPVQVNLLEERRVRVTCPMSLLEAAAPIVGDHGNAIA